MEKIKVGIIGGAGYTGGEMLRLLENHPAVQLLFVHSKSNAGKELHEVHRDLDNEHSVQFSNELMAGVDVIFLCNGHHEGKKFLQQNEIDLSVKIISLSQDFRLNTERNFEGRNFIYGMPELNRELIKTANSIANPGCFATAIQLGLLPLAKTAGLADIYTTGITGSTGAGQGMSETSHFSWRQNNIQAYKSLSHQHLGEIGETLQTFPGNKNLSVNFVPWRGDFARGIFVTSQTKSEKSLEELYELYDSFYASHPFVRISKEPIFLKQVVNTNNCFIQLEKVDNNLVIHSAIDNLLKGASGQALQNMNIMFGLEERTGLKLKANYF